MTEVQTTAKAKKPRKLRPRTREREAVRLTPKMRAFVEAYLGQAEGNATAAAKLAGYTSTGQGIKVLASRLLMSQVVRDEIERQRAELTSARIADKRERQEYLTSVMRDVAIEPKDRTKACEILGKMQGDFIEKREVEHSGKVTVEHDYAMLSDEERANLRKLLSKAATGG